MSASNEPKPAKGADAQHPENVSETGPAKSAGKVPGGVAPTADKAPDVVLEQHDAVAELGGPDPAAIAPLYNPTTPDGSPPPNNLPGPHGPQGVEHLQADPTEGS